MPPLPRTGHSIRSLLCPLAWLEAKLVSASFMELPYPALRLLYRHNLVSLSTPASVRLPDPPYHMTRSPIQYMSFPRNQPLDPISRGLPLSLQRAR